VVRKVRTGMQFLLGSDVTLAVGECTKNANQIINIVNCALRGPRSCAMVTCCVMRPASRVAAQGSRCAA